jgi:hypothetical protein
MKLPNTRKLAVLALSVLPLAGCHTGASAGPSPAASAVDARTAWLQYAKCVRDNGHADFPDPVQDGDGRWSLPVDPATVDVPACDALLRQTLQETKVKHEPTAAEMEQRLLFARCVREHGVPGYPDPGPDGVFDMPSDMRNDPKLGPAFVACRQYAPPAEPK